MIDINKAHSIVITGRGQVARALMQALEAKGFDNVHMLAREDMDITNHDKVKKMFSYIQPSLIFHTAALTKVDYCERNPEEAMLVNATGTENVVSEAKKYGASVIYFSTDYVFSGKDEGEYEEDDEPNPPNMYGRSKLAGEFYVSEYNKGIIIRTAQVFSPHGRNFIEAIRVKLSAGEEVLVVADEFGTPTYAPHLADAVLALLPKARHRIYHIRGSSIITYYDWAMAFARLARYPAEKVLPVHAQDYPRDAPRPRRAVLSMSRFLSLGLPLLPPLETAIKEFLGGDDQGSLK